jgi:hypothetical protein
MIAACALLAFGAVGLFYWHTHHRPVREKGLLRLDAGGREITELAMKGELQSPDGRNVAVGHWVSSSGLEPAGECEVPVGDYLPHNMEFRFGRLWIDLSDNYHSDGVKDGVLAAKKRVYSIRIRKGWPFVWDFSNQPDVIFASPAKDKNLHRGDEIKVEAVLVDPVLDLMIRGLRDTSRKQDRTTVLQSGKEVVRNAGNLWLDPVVTITDSSGKKVAEGLMPFG